MCLGFIIYLQKSSERRTHLFFDFSERGAQYGAIQGHFLLKIPDIFSKNAIYWSDASLGPE